MSDFNSDGFSSSKRAKFVVDDAEDNEEYIIEASRGNSAAGASAPASNQAVAAQPHIAHYLSHRPRPIFSQHSRTHSQLTVDHSFNGITPPESPRTAGFFSPPAFGTSLDGSPDASVTSLPRVNSSIISNPSAFPPPPLPTPSVGGGAGNSAIGTNPFSTPNPSHPALRMRESFASPPVRPLTIYGSVGTRPNSTAVLNSEKPSAIDEKVSLLQKSTMLDPNVPLEKPWLNKSAKDPYARVAYFLTYTIILLGVAGGALRCYFDYKNVMVIQNEGNLCPVMDEDFSLGDANGRLFGDNGLFFREVDLSGFGNGEFEMTTASSNNSYVQNGRLYIMPTLTSDSLGEAAVLGTNGPFIYNATDCTYNITHGSSYTSSTPLTDSSSSPSSSNETQVGGDVPFSEEAYLAACSAVSNITEGKVINPVQSARLSTRKSASIRYGRVEVVAKMPKGSWMWPAIWMLPVDNTYGDWPMSGEIDIVESRGNDASYTEGGSNVVRGSLNWGPLIYLNSVWRTTGFWSERRSSFADGFHTYALEWTPDWIRIYVDTRLHKMFDTKMGGTSGANGFWSYGDFPQVVDDGSGAQVALENPWVNGTKAAPFDIPFYLILDIGIGGTNGWFPDGDGSKPWLDGSNNAMQRFIQAQDTWYPTWSTNPDDRAMIIDSVKMWQLC